MLCANKDMFDLEDKKEEKRRKLWYSPLGEYIVLFSNLEFSANEWIDLLSGSKAMAKHIKGIWSFRKRTELIVNLINEYNTDNKVKIKWERLWKNAIKLSKKRNLIAHNPPFNNFKMDFDLENKKVVMDEKKEEIQKLNKPVGDPGSGLSLEEIKNDCIELRSIIIELDKEHMSESFKY